VLDATPRIANNRRFFGGIAMSSPLIFNLDEPDFEAQVVEASKTTPILVDFWADWCPPCIVLTPVLERVVNGYGGKIRLAKVEVDEGDNMRLAGRFGLRGFPTVLLFVNGEELGRFSSAHPDGWVKDFIAQYVSL
jgi:thioredoxin 1